MLLLKDREINHCFLKSPSYVRGIFGNNETWSTLMVYLLVFRVGLLN
jgi:hypothetical protein